MSREIILQNLGLIFVLGLSVLIACIGIIFLGSWVRNMFCDHIEKVEYRGAQRLGRRLMQDAYWFSEDKATMNLIMELGKDANLGYGFDASKIRNKWREDRLLNKEQGEG